MDDKVLRLLKVFDTFTDAQRKEFVESLSGYQIKTNIRSQVLKVSMGPLPTPCPYCGK
jgi:hypothetical protein